MGRIANMNQRNHLGLVILGDMKKWQIVFGLGVLYLLAFSCPTDAQRRGLQSEDIANVDNDPNLDIIFQLIEKSELDSALTVIYKTREISQDPEDGRTLTYTYYYEGKCLIHRYRTEEATKAYKKAVRLAEKFGFYNLKAASYNALTVIYGFKGQRETANAYCDSILAISNIPIDVKSDALTIKAEYLFSINEFDSAFMFRHQAYVNDTFYRDTISWVFTATDLGKSYVQKGMKDSALHFFIEGAELASKKMALPYKLGSIYLNISSIFTDLNNFHKGREYANLALNVTDKNKTKSAHNAIIYHLGYLDELEGHYESAIQHYTTASLHYDTINSTESWLKCNIGLANCFVETNQLEEAESLIKKALSKAENIGSSLSRLRLNLAEAKTLLRRNQPQLAISKLKETENTSGLLESSIYRRNIEKIYTDAYTQLGEDKLALVHLKNYYAIRDSISDKNQSFIIHDLESKYRKNIQDQEIENLTLEKSLLDHKLTRRNRVIQLGIAFLLLITLFLAVIYRMYNRIRANNQLISQSLQEKETLLREIHHRVKNNLQIISSLLSLQSRSLKDDNARQALQESQTRVRSMALIHQNLYQHDNMVQVDIKEYVTHLSQEILRTYKSSQHNISLSLDIEDLQLDLDTVIPLGLVINELITNAVKYAFPDERSGKIEIGLKHEKEDLIFCISDDGIGLPKNLDLARSNSLGFRLVNSFCNKMEAKMKVNTDNGTHIKLIIPFSQAKLTHHD